MFNIFSTEKYLRKYRARNTWSYTQREYIMLRCNLQAFSINNFFWRSVYVSLLSSCYISMQFNENQMRKRNFQQDLSYLNEVSLLLLVCWFGVFFKQVTLLELCTGESGVNLDLCETSCWTHLIEFLQQEIVQGWCCVLCVCSSALLSKWLPQQSQVHLGWAVSIAGLTEMAPGSSASIQTQGVLRPGLQQCICALLHTGEIHHWLSI